MRSAGTRSGATAALVVALALASACGPSSDGARRDDTNAAGTSSGAEADGPSSGAALVVGDDPCSSDADCVPAQCCHATACVAQEHAPTCADALCTMECRFGTIDCGGGCVCHEGRCAARLSRMEQPSLAPR